MATAYIYKKTGRPYRPKSEPGWEAVYDRKLIAERVRLYLDRVKAQHSLQALSSEKDSKETTK